MLTFLAIWVAISYLLGSISLAQVIATSLGVDLSSSGSGSAGSTNLYRCLPPSFSKSKKFSLTALAFAWDVGKGFLPIAIASSNLFTPFETLLVAAAVVTGHTFPLTYKGGKAVATGFGILLAVSPQLALTCFGIFLLGFLPTGIVAIGSALAATSLIILSLPLMPNMVFGTTGIMLGVTVLILHRNNVRRILDDQEKPLFHWRLGLRKFPENAKHCLFTIHIAGDGAEACKRDAISRFWWVRFLPAKLVHRWITKTPTWAMYMGHSKGITTLDGIPVICHVIAIPEEMSAVTNPSHPRYEIAYQRLLSSIAYMLALIPEISVVGLGAGTGITHKNGLDVAKFLKENFPTVKVTNGNTFTSVAAMLTKDKLRATVDLEKASKGIPVIMAVVGANGSVGSRVAAALMEDGDCSELLLVGNPQKSDVDHQKMINALKSQFPGNSKPVRAVTIEEAVNLADTVFLCTNAASGLSIPPELYRKGLKVIDVGKPANSNPELTQKRPDVIVVAGGHVQVPGFGSKIGLHGFTAFACCVETILHATGRTAMSLEETDAFTYVGKPVKEQIAELAHLALAMGFTVGTLYNPHTDAPISTPKISA
jgi:glycerol-3-phosphate acyltransferase PlsY